MKYLFTIAFCLLSNTSFGENTSSATATGVAKMEVVESIFLVGPEPTGENGIVANPFTRGGPEEGATLPEVIIDPNSSSAARIIINGSPGASFNIVLPPNDTIYLNLVDNRTEGPSDRIPAYDFADSVNGQGVFGPEGFASVGIGCTLNIGNPNLKTGLYKADFLITITY
jgi:hypothetical protein